MTTRTRYLFIFVSHVSVYVSLADWQSVMQVTPLRSGGLWDRRGTEGSKV